MKTRNALGTLAGIAVLGLTLQGCSAAGDPADPGSGEGKTLDVMVSANTLYPEQQQQWFDDVAAEFKEKTGADVTFETYASANDELTKIQTSVVSGQGPDIYALGTTFMPTAYATDAFVTLDDAGWEKVGGRDRFVPASIGISGPDESHEVGVPFASRPFVMAYNTELLSAAGFDAPATSWDELAEQAKAITSGDTYGLAIDYADGYNPWKIVWAMANQAGNPILDGDTARLDDPTLLTAYETYFGWLTEDHVVDPASVGWTNANALAAFASGKAGFLLMTSATSRVSLDDSDVAGKYAYALMPTIAPGMTANPADGKPATSIISGDNLVVAKYSKNQDLAFQLIEMLTSAEAQQTYFDTFGEMPTNAEAAEALQAAHPELAAVVDSSTKAVATPFSGAWSDTQLELMNVVVQSIPDLSAGSVKESDLQARLDAAQTAAQTSLDKAQ